MSRGALAVEHKPPGSQLVHSATSVHRPSPLRRRTWDLLAENDYNTTPTAAHSDVLARNVVPLTAAHRTAG